MSASLLIINEIVKKAKQALDGAVFLTADQISMYRTECDAILTSATIHASMYDHVLLTEVHNYAIAFSELVFSKINKTKHIRISEALNDLNGVAS